MPQLVPIPPGDPDLRARTIGAVIADPPRRLLLWCKTDPPSLPDPWLGWTPLHAPTHRLDVLRPSRRLERAWQRAAHAAHWIFVSRMAVRSAQALGLLPPPDGCVVWAVGPGTAAALRALGVRAQRGHGADSEALLATAALHQVAGRTVALFCARGGRELLADVLADRGARVVTVYVYRRRVAAWPAGTLAAVRRADAIRVVVASRAQAERAARRLADRPVEHWIAASPRIAATLRALGASAVSVAAGADDAALEAACRASILVSNEHC